MSTILVSNFAQDKVEVLSLLNSLAKNYRFYLHSQALMESEFTPVGNNDIEKKKSTDKFTKRLRAMSVDMDALHKIRSSIISLKNDFLTAYKLSSNELGYNCLAKLYASLDYHVKEYGKLVKQQQKKNPELWESVEEFSVLNDLNVFDMMKRDFDYLEPIIIERQEHSKKQWPDFVPRKEIKSSPEWEVVKEKYKEQMKKMKEDNAKK